ncbi:MAG: 50S ribosomal protein L5 [Candidatus Omnitrophica bacterium]|nr:50S ribosomal protein L5 [Candidatus Omnitrophota bacterium]
MTQAGATITHQGGVPRMLERYRKEIARELAKQFKHQNLMAAARLEKIVLNIGCGEAAHDAKVLEAVQRDLALIAGQRPLVTRAKRAISNFKIREGDPVGCKVTLRRARMYEFLDRLVSVALPRIRDFRGLDPRGFDQGGNFAFGISEHTIFPEIQVDKVQYPLGMDIVVVTSARTREEAHALLKAFGFPFADNKS